SIPGRRILNVDAKIARASNCRKRAGFGKCGSSARHPITIAIPRATTDPMYVRALRDMDSPCIWARSTPSELISIVGGRCCWQDRQIHRITPDDAETGHRGLSPNDAVA